MTAFPPNTLDRLTQVVERWFTDLLRQVVASRASRIVLAVEPGEHLLQVRLAAQGLRPEDGEGLTPLDVPMGVAAAPGLVVELLADLDAGRDDRIREVLPVDAKLTVVLEDIGSRRVGRLSIAIPRVG